MVMPEEPAVTELVDIDRALALGELFRAYDLASEGLRSDPQSIVLKHRAILAVARSGATAEAQRLYRFWQMDAARPPERQLASDVAALGARLLKDVAFEAAPEQQPALLERAADAYESIFHAHRTEHAGVNAATLHLLAGNAERARQLASETLKVIVGDDYYAHASRAECELLLGNREGAASEIALAGLRSSERADPAARTGTRRQLGRVCEAMGIGAEILDPLRSGCVVRYLGHMPGSRLTQDQAIALAPKIAGLLQQLDASTGYGALAAGADIIFAEALIARGADLNVVLPFDVDSFREVSVRQTGGEEWVPRFDRCLAGATSVTIANDDWVPGDVSAFRYGGTMASGMALLRSQFLDAPVVQVAIWDGGPSGGPGGTAEDVATWAKLGLVQHVITPAGAPIADFDEALPPSAVPQAGIRENRPIVFGDLAGFSSVHEAEVPAVFEHVFGALAAAIEPLEGNILVRNTWGDGIFLVFDEIDAAAECLLRMQEALSLVDRPAIGLSQDMQLRLGAHYGPMLKTLDPMTRRETFVGVQVNRAARIEPITPPGIVYVTEAFAAALALRPQAGFTCDYKGRVALAKKAGEYPVLSLRRKGL